MTTMDPPLQAALFGLLALVSAATVRVMIGVRVMDTPNARSSHARPTPKGGGVGIVAAFLLGMAVLYSEGAFARTEPASLRAVIVAASAIALVSFADDVLDWPFTGKLAAQLLAALVAIAAGLFVRVYRIPYVGAADLGWFGVAATLFWIVFVTNAMNFIDGLDGLAGGVALIACLFLAYIAAWQGGLFVYFAALLLAAGLFGFLPFNFPRARIFMGDVGSQFCGFLLAILGVAASRFERVDLSFAIVPMLLSGVLFDVAFTLVRRALAGESLTRAHRGHLYQVAQRSGMDARTVALLHWGFACWGGVCCLVFLAAPPQLKPAALLLPALPQPFWVVWVVRAARKAALTRW
jgi:UDP-GlcNAc:undecaprenyl-phosphate GlcNAc-1-phosphate transferase